MVVLTIPDALLSDITTESYLKITWIQDTPALPVNVTLRRFVPPGSFPVVLSIATGQSGDNVDWFVPSTLEPDTYIINLKSSVSGVGSRTFDVKRNLKEAPNPTTISRSSTSRASLSDAANSKSSTTSFSVVSLPSQVASNAGSMGVGIGADPSTTPSPSIFANPNVGLSTGIKAAIGIGAAALFLISIVLLGALFYLRRGHKKNCVNTSPVCSLKEDQQTTRHTGPEEVSVQHRRQAKPIREDTRGRVELNGEKLPSEMAEARSLHELDGGTAT